MDIAMMYIFCGCAAARIRSGTDAKTAITIPIKCVIALPGSLMCSFLCGFLLMTGLSIFIAFS